MKKLFYTKYWWFFLLLILIVINFLASRIHFRFDLTKEKRYTLSKATQTLVRRIDTPITIDVFLKGEFPAGFKKLANATIEFLQVIKEYNSSNIEYRFIYPTDEIPGSTKKYADTLVALGANPIDLTVQVKEGQQQKYVFPVALLSYNGKQQLLNLYPGGNRIISQVEINNAEALMEYQFVKALDELMRTDKSLIAYSIGNGEPTGPETYDLQQSLGQRYHFFTFNLKTQPFIPDTFKALFIVKPTEKFTEDEKIKIDQFVMRGGNLVLFLDELVAEQDSLQFKSETVAYDRDLNLSDLLFRYGVRINPDLVMDLQCDFLPFIVNSNASNPQTEFLQWNYYPLFQPRNNHLINKNLGLISGRFVNSIDTIQANDIKKTILLSSSPNSRIISTPALISLNENKVAPQDEKFKLDNIPVAVLLEGKFPSLYQNRIASSIKDSLKKLGMPYQDSSEINNKIIVTADGDMVLNDVSVKFGPLTMGWNKYTFEDESGRYFIPVANKSFLLNSLEYLTNKPAIIETGNKEIVLRLLDSKKIREQKTTWQFINIALPILVIILLGVIYQQVRKSRYAG